MATATPTKPVARSPLDEPQLPRFIVNDKAEFDWEIVGPDGLVYRRVAKEFDGGSDLSKPTNRVAAVAAAEELDIKLAEERQRLSVSARFIREHFAERLTLPRIADRSGMSPFHFHRRFSFCYGETPKQMQTRHQVAHALELMAKGTPLGDIAPLVGLAHQSHFCIRFKALVGMTPTQWLRQQREEQRRASK